MWPFDKRKDTTLLPDIIYAPIADSSEVALVMRKWQVQPYNPKEKIGICMVGGGSKGRWQVGYLARLNQLGLLKYVSFIAGTSVGGLNAMITAKYLSDFQKVVDVWRGIKENSDVYLGNIPGDFWSFLTALLSGKLTGKGILDVSPLKALVQKHLGDEGKLAVPVAVVTTDRLRGRKVVLNSEEGEKHVDMALATCAVPMAFPPYQDVFMDGACVDNAPIVLLEQLGCTKILILYCDPDMDKKVFSVEAPSVLNCGISAANALYAVQEEKTYELIELIKENRALKGESPIEYAHCYPSQDTGQLLTFTKVDLLQKGYDDAVAQVTGKALEDFLLS